MSEYIPPALDWVREQVELYESSGGTKGNTLLDTGDNVRIIIPNSQISSDVVKNYSLNPTIAVTELADSSVNLLVRP